MFEFIEDIEVTAADHIRNTITGYRRHGFMTALDDLGAGHAGLGLLVLRPAGLDRNGPEARPDKGRPDPDRGLRDSAPHTGTRR